MRQNMLLGKCHRYDEVGNEILYGYTSRQLLELTATDELPAYIYIKNHWVEVPCLTNMEMLPLELNEIPEIKIVTKKMDWQDSPRLIQNEFVRISASILAKLENVSEVSSDIIYLLLEKDEEDQSKSEFEHLRSVLTDLRDEYPGGISIDDLVFRDIDIKICRRKQSHNKNKSGNYSVPARRERALIKFLTYLQRMAKQKLSSIDFENLNIGLEDLHVVLKTVESELFANLTFSSFESFWQKEQSIAACNSGPKINFDLGYIFPIINNKIEFNFEFILGTYPRNPPH